MKAAHLYQHLEHDFIAPGMSEQWFECMESLSDLICENFRRRSVGLVCDFAAHISQVFTAVFPSNEVMQAMVETGARDMLLFVHHPAIWDIRKAPAVFQQMDRELLHQFKENRVSIYNLHLPLDNYGEYSTSVTLAKALGVRPEKPFAPYRGAMAGVFGRTGFAVVQDLKEIFEEAVNHEVSLYLNGEGVIRDKRVAVAAGGGLIEEVVKEAAQNNVNVFATGITINNDHTAEVHALAEELEMNILGGTHYSTEKFACIQMADYFQKLGVPCEFIEGKPAMEDL